MRKKRKPQPAQQSIDALAAQAESHLRIGHFREAMDAYKQLLKREQRPQWCETLAGAYLGRAQQLAAKSLYKEAAVLWENMASLCGERHLDWYIDWLLQAGRFGRGARLFAGADTAFRDSPAGRGLAVRLAGLLLCGHEEIAESLPPDSPLLPQRDRMLAAMEAYCRGDADAMRESLKAIVMRLSLDLDGVLNVSAMEKSTGLEKSIIIDNALRCYEQEEIEAAQARINALFEEEAAEEGKISEVEEAEQAQLQHALVGGKGRAYAGRGDP